VVKKATCKLIGFFAKTVLFLLPFERAAGTGPSIGCEEYRLPALNPQ
jgi:hypothetical protein